MVNSPLLFCIFIMALLNSFGLNTIENRFAVTYADDLIVGIAGKQPLKLQTDLETLINYINNFYKTWNLRMNPDKCETAVFRRESNHLSQKALNQIKEFKISTSSPNTGELIEVPHKMVITLSRNKSSSQNQNITDDSSNSAETKSHNYEPKRRKQSTLESCLERSLSFEVTYSQSLIQQEVFLVVTLSSNRAEIPSSGSIPNELKQYLDQPLIDRKSDPIEFWASSVASGRPASAVNLAIPDNRSRLTGDHIKERVLLMSIPDDYWFE
ncbi:hypothetical protein KQX54_014785 [Cotesia glomerata]|uniref:Reverse transcriptase domain-containing protein n=1 Tax=Cotesia glomerata TaxID=32391 RepID=A0AAV7HYA0_COTGL|nr:hypothetical protein KQX54_014785 [Cotesia glomerata]